MLLSSQQLTGFDRRLFKTFKRESNISNISLRHSCYVHPRRVRRGRQERSWLWPISTFYRPTTRTKFDSPVPTYTSDPSFGGEDYVPICTRNFRSPSLSFPTDSKILCQLRSLSLPRHQCLLQRSKNSIVWFGVAIAIDGVVYLQWRTYNIIYASKTFFCRLLKKNYPKIGFMYHDDHGPKHAAKIVKRFLDERKVNVGIKMADKLRT